VLRGWQLRPREKRCAKIGKTRRGKGTKWMVLVDGAGTPLGAYLDAASPAEVTLLEQTLASQPIRGRPERLIADRGYCGIGSSGVLWHRLFRGSGGVVSESGRLRQEAGSSRRPPGRRLSPQRANVAYAPARAAGVGDAAITSTLSPTSSAARSGHRSNRPSAQR
jgi:hypothetical protein